jgi:hypothetical protein
MKNILIISFWHTDINSVGSYRTRSIENTLKKNGFNVHVISGSYVINNYEVDGNTHIFKSNSRFNTNKFILILDLIKRKINFYLLNKYVHPLQRWIDLVLHYKNHLYESIKPDCILCSYPPVESLDLGRILSIDWNVPLITDFRDPFLINPLEQDLKFDIPKSKFYQELEFYLINNSLFSTTVSHSITQDFIYRYPSKSIFTVMNGFDEIPIILPKVTFKNVSKINILHSGRLSLSDSSVKIDGFISALDLISNNLLCREKLLFHFIGDLSKKEINLLQPYAEIGLVRIWGTQSRLIAQSFQREADYLMLITQVNNPSVISGKLIDYLSYNKFILALTSGTEAYDIINNIGIGKCANPSKPNEIYDLFLMVALNQLSISNLNIELLSSYSRYSQNSIFVKKLSILER